MPMRTRKEQNAYQNEWLKARRRVWFAENGPCVDCGGTTDLQVDHIDPSTKVTHRIWSYRKERREAELAKCCVRCRSCHAKKSAKEVLRGEAVTCARLTESDVLLIRHSTKSSVVLAAEFGVAIRTISDVRSRHSWAHVK